MKRTATILFVLLVFASTVFTQNRAEDLLGCATEKSKSLNFLVGDWVVFSNFRVSKNRNEWEKTIATSKITHLFKDCIYQELLNGKRNERPHQFMGIFSYNNMSDKLQWAGGHSEHGVISLYEGNFVDDELVLENQMMLRSNLIYFRIVIRKTDVGFDVRSERSPDRKLWDAGWYMSYKRKV